MVVDPAAHRPVDEMTIDVTQAARAAAPLRPLLVLLATLLVLLVGGAPVSAHDSTDGSTVVTIDDRRVIVGASVAFDELGYVDTSGDGSIGSDELAEQEATVAPELVATVRNGAAVGRRRTGRDHRRRCPGAQRGRRQRHRRLAVRDAGARVGSARR